LKIAVLIIFFQGTLMNIKLKRIAFIWNKRNLLKHYAYLLLLINLMHPCILIMVCFKVQWGIHSHTRSCYIETEMERESSSKGGGDTMLWELCYEMSDGNNTVLWYIPWRRMIAIFMYFGIYNVLKKHCFITSVHVQNPR